MEKGGLDTLAALCGGASKAQTDNGEKISISNTNISEQKQDPGLEADGKETNQTIASAPTQPSQASTTATANTVAAPSTAIPNPINSTLQQWQAIAPPAQYAVPNHAAATAAMASILQAAVQNPMRVAQPADPNSLNALQQIAYYQYMAAAQAQAQQITQAQRAVPVAAAAPVVNPGGVVADQNVAATYSYTPNVNATQVPATITDDSKKRTSSSSQQPQQCQQASQQAGQSQYIIPSANAASASKDPPLAAQKSSMQPPPPPSQAQTLPSALSTSSFASTPSHRPIAPTSSKLMPLKTSQTTIIQRPVLETNSSISNVEDKKQLKRAANRRSAQLSRKRKKQFIEELKEENDELRRKEQILKSIPDLIVVFDSAGKLWFVSHSVNRFLNFTPSELEGSSFWDRLCDESVRLLKAAFMDALAARKNDMDTTPLGSGVWELRLVDKDGSHKVVTLNGVVHFSGDAPECVCSIRPRDGNANTTSSKAPKVAQDSIKTISTKSAMDTMIQPHQSVIASEKIRGNSDVQIAKGRASINPPAANSNGRLISDGDSGSVISESIVSESGSE